MGNVLVKEETLTQIADAIREKSGTDGLYKPGEMPDAILDISTYSGEGADPTKPIRFYDPYGNLVYSYSIREFSELEDLPDLPKINGLTAQEWNWNRSSILEMNGEVEVGSLYVTDDGATRIYIELPKEALNPRLGFRQASANSIVIDWGDGSPYETSDVAGNDTMVSIEHKYAKSGSYIIRLIPNERATFTFIGDAYSTRILHKTTDYNNGNRVFGGAIKKIELGRGITEFTGRCFNSFSIETVTIPAEVKTFNTAFQECYALKTLTFPKGVSSLPPYAVRDARQLKRVLFSESYLNMNGSAFDDCNGLEYLIIPNQLNLGGSSSIFSNCVNLKRLVLPPKLSAVSAEMFYGCSLLKCVEIKGPMKRLGFNVFYNCTILEEIEIPETLVEWSSGVFYNCKALKKINLPSGMTKITGSLFGNCYSLSEMVIGENVTSIETLAFQNCSGIENFYLKPMIPPVLTSDNSFSGISSTCKMHVPKGCLEVYQTAEYWSTYAEHMVEMEE